MVKCCVPGCGSVGKRIFHSFPANPELRRQWIQRTKSFHLTEKELKGYSKICRYHFRETDFVVNARNQRGLKADAVPSLRLPVPETTSKSESNLDQNDHNYSAKDPSQKMVWKRRNHPEDLQFDVQCIEIIDESFSVESSQVKDREFEKFKIQSSADKRRICELMEELKHCKKQLRTTEKNLESSNKKLENVRQELKRTKLNKSNVFKYLRTIFNGEQLVFFNMQLRNAGKKPPGRRYTPEEKSLALILYKHSPKNYRFMRKFFALPSKRTLGRHTAQLLFKTGVNERIFELIKQKVKSLPENGRYCSISWDEVSLKSQLDYNFIRDEIDGFVDLAMIRKPVFATHALTFMIRGIDIAYKQAIGFFFTDGLKSFELVEVIKLMIKAVSDTDLKIMMSVCDQVYVNAKAVRELIDPSLKSSKSLTGSLIYKIGTNSIIHCYDPPHIIKGIRNNLMTKFLKHNIAKRWNIDQREIVTAASERWASWEDVIRTYKWNNKLLPKITEEHIQPNKSKMKVSIATQVFSQTFGDLMLKYSNDRDLPQHFSDTAEILLFFNDVFDSINGSETYDENELKCPVTENSIHFVFWNYALKMLSNMQFLSIETGEATNRTTILQKLKSTILGYVEVSRQCLNLNMTAVGLRNMNQDALENFFGNVRSCCHNASSLIATHFRSAFTTVFMTNSIAHSIKSNCEPDSSTPFLSDVHYLLLQKKCAQNTISNMTNDNSIQNGFESLDAINTDCEYVNSENSDSNIIEVFENDCYDPIIFAPEFSEQELSVTNKEAISNLSKSVFDKLLDASKCDDCRLTLETCSNFDVGDGEDNVKLPSELYTRNFQKIFCNIDESLQYICAETCLRDKVIKSLENVEVEDMGCVSHLEYVNSKFKEISTIFGITSFCKRINNLLSGKNQIYSEHFNLIEHLAFTFNQKKKRIGKHSDIFTSF